MDSPARGGPTRIGRYDIEDVLGQGGMGRVYLARDSVLGRRVALKVLRDDLGLPPETKRALLSRMQNEARAAAAISHPGIVTLHDMGEDDALGLYLVFEYVEGPTLRERIARGPLPLEEVAEIAERLGDALSVAHAAGVIHRDVKPENVILAKTGPKIADFGIARAPDSTLTQSQNVFGTPAYSAPEALRVGDFSDASDQFSFAATLYEAITGERAFRGEDALAVATSVTKDPPPPLSASLGDPRVLGRVEAVLARGLAKEPDRRYPSSAELGSALARIIREPPPPSLSSQIARTPGPPSSMTRTSTPPPAPAENLRAYAEAPVRPSLVMRQQTHRVQNIVAALALIVIVALVIFGKKRSHDDDAAPDPSASASASAPPTAHSAKPNGHAPHRPRHPDGGAAHPPAPVSAAPTPSASPTPSAAEPAASAAP